MAVSQLVPALNWFVSHRLAMVTLVLLCTGHASADDRVPVQGSLVHSLEAGRTNVGDSVLAKVRLRN